MGGTKDISLNHWKRASTKVAAAAFAILVEQLMTANAEAQPLP